MKIKIGSGEAGAAVTLFSLCPFLMFVIDRTYNISGFFSVFNLIVALGAAFIAFYCLKKYTLTFGGLNITDVVKTSFPKYIFIIFTLLSFAVIFLYTCISFSLYSGSIINFGTEKLATDDISLFLCISAAACATLGMEALTRSSYISLIITFILISVMTVITLDAWDAENIYPIFGKDVLRSAVNFHPISAFGGIFAVLFIADKFRCKKNFTSCVKKAILVIFMICAMLLLIYVFTVPYPMGKLYFSSLEAVFSSVSKGSIFHRYEIILLFVIILINVFSASVGLIISSSILCSLTNFDDTKPFVICLSLLLYNSCSLKFNTDLYEFVSCLMFALSIAVPLITVFKRRNGIKRNL